MKNDTNEIREGRFCKRCGQKLRAAFIITVSWEIIAVLSADLSVPVWILMQKIYWWETDFLFV